MFTLYEVAGVVTNLAAGLMGARWGIKTTLLSGLALQLAGIGVCSVCTCERDYQHPGTAAGGCVRLPAYVMLST